MSATTKKHDKGTCPNCGSRERYRKTLRCAPCQRGHAKTWSDKNPGYSTEMSREYRSQDRLRKESLVL